MTRDIRPPTPAWDHWTGRADLNRTYLPGYNNLATAASAAGLRPTTLTDATFSNLATTHGWADATTALYAKIARYAGIAISWKYRTPEPETTSAAISYLLHAEHKPPHSAIVSTRAAILCHLLAATDWALPTITTLRVADVSYKATAATVTIAISVGPDAGTGATVTSGGMRDLLLIWDHLRPQTDTLGGPYLLPTLHAGPGTLVGKPLSTRGAQQAFRAHAQRIGADLRESAANLQDSHTQALANHYQTLTIGAFRRIARTDRHANVRSRR